MRRYVYQFTRGARPGDVWRRAQPRSDNVAVRAAIMAAWTVCLVVLLVIVIPIALLFIALFLIFAIIGKISAGLRGLFGSGSQREPFENERENVRVIPPGESARR